MSGKGKARQQEMTLRMEWHLHKRKKNSSGSLMNWTKLEQRRKLPSSHVGTLKRLMETGEPPKDS
jgi:hypothetical protein